MTAKMIVAGPLRRLIVPDNLIPLNELAIPEPGNTLFIQQTGSINRFQMRTSTEFAPLKACGRGESGASLHLPYSRPSTKPASAR